jgi:hypothetical protein
VNHSPQYIILNGLTGISASFIAFTATLIQGVEAWIRLATSFLGLVIAIITLINLVKKKTTK